MRITPYNKDEAIEMLRARAFFLLMSDEVGDVEGPNAKPLWDLVGDMTSMQAHDAIVAFQQTQ